MSYKKDWINTGTNVICKVDVENVSEYNLKACVGN
jgi:hypothetical protein